jgi:hypothetical protein
MRGGHLKLEIKAARKKQVTRENKLGLGTIILSPQSVHVDPRLGKETRPRIVGLEALQGKNQVFKKENVERKRAKDRILTAFFMYTFHPLV